MLILVIVAFVIAVAISHILLRMGNTEGRHHKLFDRYIVYTLEPQTDGALFKANIPTIKFAQTLPIGRYMVGFLPTFAV